MSAAIRVTILLIVLIDSFCSSTASSEKLKRLDIFKCRCTRDDVPRGKPKCSYPLVPTDKKGKQELYKCLCRAATQKNRQDLQRFCSVQSAPLL